MRVVSFHEIEVTNFFSSFSKELNASVNLIDCMSSLNDHSDSSSADCTDWEGYSDGVKAFLKKGVYNTSAVCFITNEDWANCCLIISHDFEACCFHAISKSLDLNLMFVEHLWMLSDML